MKVKNSNESKKNSVFIIPEQDVKMFICQRFFSGYYEFVENIAWQVNHEQYKLAQEFLDQLNKLFYPKAFILAFSITLIILAIISFIFRVVIKHSWRVKVFYYSFFSCVGLGCSISLWLYCRSLLHTNNLIGNFNLKYKKPYKKSQEFFTRICTKKIN